MVLQNADVKFTTEADKNNNERYLDTLQVNGFSIPIHDIEDNLCRHDYSLNKVYDNIDELNEKIQDLENTLKTTKLKLYALIATGFIFSIILFFIK